MLILDGAQGTELESRGCNVNHKLWSALVLVNNEKALYDLHKDYFAAGADIATTATYQASIQGFVDEGVCKTEKEAAALMAKAVNIAQKARDDFWSEYQETVGMASNRRRPIVAASIGPYGAFLGNGAEYSGEYGEAFCGQDLIEFHTSRLQAVLSANPDMIACETIPRLDEALLLMRLISDMAPETPYWMSFSIRRKCSDSIVLADQSISLEQAVKQLTTTPDVVLPMAIGANCFPLELVGDVIKAVDSYPKILYPNSGELYNAESKTWSRFDASSHTKCLTDIVDDAISTDVTILGGCCRVGPSEIAEVANKVRLAKLGS